MNSLPRDQHGMSLIELMVAMTIGLVLIGGAIYVYDEGRAALRVNDTLSRLQENARFALDVMEPDLRLAGYWGRHTDAVAVEGRATDVTPLAVNVAGDCGPDWSIDIETSLEGSNNRHPGWTCLGGRNDYLADTDAFAVRHASAVGVATADLEVGRLYVRSHESGRARLFNGTAEPNIFDGQNNALLANGYYVRPFTFDGDDMPSLRRRSLTNNGGAPSMIDQEVMSGVEDLQFQFGIDTNGDGSVNRYVDADNAVLNAGPRVLAVRVWLLMRSQQPEVGFTDDRTYRFADRKYNVPRRSAQFRRLLVSRTIFLRNESIVESAS